MKWSVCQKVTFRKLQLVRYFSHQAIYLSGLIEVLIQMFPEEYLPHNLMLPAVLLYKLLYFDVLAFGGCIIIQ